MSIDSIKDMFDLDGCVAFISGATGHLGGQMATILAEAGALVLLNGRNKVKLDALEKQITGKGLRARAFCFSITDSEKLMSFFDEITQDYGRLDIIVNNAYSSKGISLEDTKLDDFNMAFNVGATAPFLCVKAALPLLRNAVSIRGDASVINIASMYGSVSPDPKIYEDINSNNPPCYGAAKGAIIQLTRYLGCYLAQDNIRVNAISPGTFPQPSVSQEFTNKLLEKVPLNRIGEPSDLNGAIMFLASKASSYVTGINLPVDGGWTAW